MYQRAVLIAGLMAVLALAFCAGCLSEEGGSTIIGGSPIPNDPPVVAAIPPQVADEGVPFTLDMSLFVTDTEDYIGHLDFTIVSSEGSFSGWTYANTFTAQGTYIVNFVVTDRDGKVTLSSFTVNVLPYTNEAPVVAAIPQQLAGTWDLFTLDVSPYVTDDVDNPRALKYIVALEDGMFHGPIYMRTFEEKGLYTINFEVEDSGKLVSTGSFDVLVYDKPVADFSATPTYGAAPVTVQFTDESTGFIDTWAWDFNGDGVVDSTKQNPAWTFAASGWHDVTLTVTGVRGSDTYTKPAFVQVVSTIWYVDDSVGSSGNGTSWATAFKTLEEGLDAADSGELVLVADGTYTGASNRDLDFGGKNLCLKAAGTGCVIDCEGAGRAFIFENDETRDAVLMGLTITRGQTDDEGAGVYCYGASPTFADCTITECKATGDDGGGVYCEQGASPLFSNCALTYNMTYEYGGAVYCEYGSSPAFVHCTIMGNLAEDEGGAISCWYGSNPSFDNCVITQNLCEYDGGAIYCYYYSGVSLTDSVLTYNVTYYEGGAIGCYYNCDLYMTNCVVAHNAAYNDDSEGGGGIYCYEYCSAYLNNCIIKDNVAYYYGGGIYMYDYGRLVMNDCIVTGNANYDDGGGIYCYDDCELKMTNCIVSGNVGDSEGGGIYLYYSNFEIKNSTIADNTGAEYGGGVYTESCYSGKLENCTITGNACAYSGYGAGLYLDMNSTYGTIIIRECTFSNNEAGDYGAAFYIEDCNRAFVIDCDISNNRAGDYYGAFYAYGSDYMEVRNCRIENNSSGEDNGGAGFSTFDTVKMKDCYVARNINGYDNGALEFSSITNVEMTGCSVVENMVMWDGIITLGSCTNIEITDCDISRNFMDDDAAIDLGSGNCVITNCTFFENRCNNYGGAVYCSSNATMTAVNCTFDRNSALFNGGAIYASGAGDQRFENCVFTGNSAGQYGGAVYLDHDSTARTAEFINCLFAGNLSDELGGAVYAYRYFAVEATNCTFSDNRASDYGGAIYLSQDTTSAVINNSILWGNIAFEDGNELYLDNSTVADLFNSCYANSTGDVVVISGSVNPTSCIYVNPLFVDPDNGNYRLQDTPTLSPCIDTGDDALLPADDNDLDDDGDKTEALPVDLDGNTRSVNGTVDMGAYEKQ